jgi:DnaJ family protein B protein 4
VFIIDEKSHSVFTRDGNDLIITQNISLAEALTGYTVHLTTLDGKNLSIPITNVIHPNYEEVVPREGMPIQKDLAKRGNLRIKFNIKFPTRLTTEQKAGIRELLGSMSKYCSRLNVNIYIYIVLFCFCFLFVSFFVSFFLSLSCFSVRA